jgi:PAS domain S-box-containing protein
MGVTSEQIRGRTVYELWPGELAEKYHQMDLELMRKREHQVYEFEVKGKDGRKHPVIYAKDVFLDKDGEVAGLVGAFIDITDRKQADAERARLTMILENTSDLVGISYPDGRGMYMNAAGRRMAGFEAGEDLGRHYYTEVHPDWARRIVQEVGMPAAMAQGIWEGESAVLNRRDGREIPVSQVIMVHRSAGGDVDCISTIMRDISERKTAEKALKDNMAILAEAERIGHTGS